MIVIVQIHIDFTTSALSIKQNFCDNAYVRTSSFMFSLKVPSDNMDNLILIIR